MTTRVAVVTGGGSGIGAASALALAQAGWAVVVAGRRKDRLDEVARRAPSGAGELRAIVTDVTDEPSVARLFDAVTVEFGRLDLLFNNAGISAPPAEVDELPLTDWHAVLAVNVTGMFLCARRAFALMRTQQPRGGRIINNGSVSATTPRPLSLAYTASKHAVTGMTKSLALDGRKYDIACGQIDVGNAVTEMTGDAEYRLLQPDGQSRAEAVIDVGHVARSIVHMAELPLEANVAHLTVMATAMPFVGRG